MHVVGRGRGQEDGGPGEVLRPAPPPGRDPGHDALAALPVILQRLGVVGLDVARRTRIQPRGSQLAQELCRPVMNTEAVAAFGSKPP